VKKSDLIPALFWLALGAFVSFKSLGLDLGVLESPGPGMFPFLIGITLILCSLPIVVVSVTSGKEEMAPSKESVWRGINFSKVGMVVASLAIYAVVLEKIGYFLSAFLVLIILFRSIGSKKWSSSVIIAFLTTVMAYFLFAVLLGVELPAKLVRML
jgi:putative tricarboxylic transport membrane protein